MTCTHLHMAVVDDDASVLKALARLLRACGYDVTAYASGAEFLGSLASGLPDCVVMDIHMPELTGLDVQAELEARDVRVPIIFITAYNDSALRQRALEHGAIAYLNKPLTEDTLIAAIKMAVANKHPC